MKRIFIAVTLVLGIAGAIAAKANLKSVTYWYKNPGCTSSTFTLDPCIGTATDCIYDFGTPGAGVQQLYTSSTCDTKAKRN